MEKKYQKADRQSLDIYIYICIYPYLTNYAWVYLYIYIYIYHISIDRNYSLIVHVIYSMVAIWRAPKKATRATRRLFQDVGLLWRCDVTVLVVTTCESMVDQPWSMAMTKRNIWEIYGNSIFTGHDSGTEIGGTYHIYGLCKAYLILSKITYTPQFWPYMVLTYLHWIGSWNSHWHDKLLVSWGHDPLLGPLISPV